MTTCVHFRSSRAITQQKKKHFGAFDAYSELKHISIHVLILNPTIFEMDRLRQKNKNL